MMSVRSAERHLMDVHQIQNLLEITVLLFGAHAIMLPTFIVWTSGFKQVERSRNAPSVIVTENPRQQLQLSGRNEESILMFTVIDEIWTGIAFTLAFFRSLETDLKQVNGNWLEQVLLLLPELSKNTTVMQENYHEMTCVPWLRFHNGVRVFESCMALMLQHQTSRNMNCMCAHPNSSQHLWLTLFQTIDNVRNLIHARIINREEE